MYFLESTTQYKRWWPSDKATTYTVDTKFSNMYSAASLSPIKTVVNKSIRIDLADNTVPYNSDTSTVRTIHLKNIFN